MNKNRYVSILMMQINNRKHLDNNRTLWLRMFDLKKPWYVLPADK